MTKKRWMLALIAIAGIGATAPSYSRAFRVDGHSDAPSFLVGDRVLVAKVAYDIRLPHTDRVIVSHSRPQPGDVVMFRPSGRRILVFKRVVGCPGDIVVMCDNHLEINDAPLRYESVSANRYEAIAKENGLGEFTERELGNGSLHLITHTSGASLYASFGPVRLPKDHYFVLRGNRDHREGSRMYGSIPRRSIFGKVFRLPRPVR